MGVGNYELVVEDAELRKAVTITWDEPRVTMNPRFHIGVTPFFNSSESFKVLVYSDGVTKDCKICCRVEDIKRGSKAGHTYHLPILYSAYRPFKFRTRRKRRGFPANADLKSNAKFKIYELDMESEGNAYESQYGHFVSCLGVFSKLCVGSST